MPVARALYLLSIPLSLIGVVFSGVGIWWPLDALHRFGVAFDEGLILCGCACLLGLVGSAWLRLPIRTRYAVQVWLSLSMISMGYALQVIGDTRRSI